MLVIIRLNNSFLYSDEEINSSFFHLISKSLTFFVRILIGSFFRVIEHFWNFFLVFNFVHGYCDIAFICSSKNNIGNVFDEFFMSLINLKNLDSLIVIRIWEEEDRKLFIMEMKRFLMVNCLLMCNLSHNYC